MNNNHVLEPSLINFKYVEELASRKKLAKMLIKLFDHWDIDTETRLKLLGLSINSRALLSKYAVGEQGIPNSRDCLDRAGYLLAIHKALRLLYPQNPKTRYKWITLKNKAFNNYTPIDIMINEGIIGLARVTRYLDFVRGH
jgi:hypothetical protein